MTHATDRYCDAVGWPTKQCADAQHETRDGLLALGFIVTFAAILLAASK